MISEVVSLVVVFRFISKRHGKIKRASPGCAAVLVSLGFLGGQVAARVRQLYSRRCGRELSSTGSQRVVPPADPAHHPGTGAAAANQRQGDLAEGPDPD